MSDIKSSSSVALDFVLEQILVQLDGTTNIVKIPVGTFNFLDAEGQSTAKSQASLLGTANPDRGKRFEAFEKLINGNNKTLREFIEAARTGSFINLVKEQLNIKVLKSFPQFQSFALYNTSEDSERFLTIPSINSPKRRVLYLFHIWSLERLQTGREIAGGYQE
ncbi:hypothetical protein F4801DRAFT_581930 [Xylaria longipes]|nr:hypothetical protein F4801DRAFT_581930 [Xylaria longipes]RYC58863.1 hypothetical protein CHU98_g7338 [Xylaria longipes]